MQVMEQSLPKKAIVVGAGISGLTAAVYLQRSGIQTFIFEKATGPGGVSTSWKRKGYIFEGGIHWLIGAKKEIPLHQIWLETGALQENNPVYFKDPIYTLVDKEGTMPLFRDLHGMEIKGLRDRIALWRLRFHLACFKNFHQPISDLRGLKVRHRRPFSIVEYVKMLPAVLVTPFLVAQSARRYAKWFKNPRIRALLAAVVEPDINALSFIYTLGTFQVGDSGYPKGGSLKMALNMAETFLGLGGQIRYQTPVEKILPEGNNWSVRVGNEVFKADAVIVSADARSAIDTLFNEPLQVGWAKKMRAGLRTTQCMFLGVGIEADLSSWPRSMQIVLPHPLENGQRGRQLCGPKARGDGRLFGSDRGGDTGNQGFCGSDGHGYPHHLRALLWHLRRQLHDGLAAFQPIVPCAHPLSGRLVFYWTADSLFRRPSSCSPKRSHCGSNSLQGPWSGICWALSQAA